MDGGEGPGNSGSGPFRYPAGSLIFPPGPLRRLVLLASVGEMQRISRAGSILWFGGGGGWGVEGVGARGPAGSSDRVLPRLRADEGWAAGQGVRAPCRLRRPYRIWWVALVSSEAEVLEAYAGGADTLARIALVLTRRCDVSGSREGRAD